jgi:hypothetical protein
MSGPAKLALGLWLVLAAVVFNVTFDWQVRTANYAFVRSQLAQYRHGLAVPTINDGFRPHVRAAAGRSALWLVLISTGGIALSAYAAGGRYRETSPTPAAQAGAGEGGTTRTAN